jgi:hypothetical protein
MITARLTVVESVQFAGGETVKMSAVYTADKSSPNYSFSKWTSSAQLTISITNPDAIGKLEVGKTYDLTFAPAAD